MSRGSQALHRALTHAVATVALVASTFAVAGGATADQQRDTGSDTEVERIALTDERGAPTDAGLGGVDQLQTSASGAEAQSADSADGDADPDAADGHDDEPVLLTAATETDLYYVLAVTWQATSDLDVDTCIFVRVLEGATWSEWLELDIEQGSVEPGGVAGTDAFVTSGATGVQVQVNTGGVLPANLTLSLIPDGASLDGPTQADVGDPPPVEPDEAIAVEREEPVAEDDWREWPETASGAEQHGAEQTGAGGGPAGTALGGVASMGVPPAAESLISPQVLGNQPMAPVFANPGLRTRAEWGADESIMDWSPRYVDLRAAVVHHTAGTNNYTEAQVPAIIRSIYHYHAITRGWGDIGYNFLVDRFGRAWEGRSGTLASPAGQMVIGGHAVPMNTHTLGISVMGTYTEERASTTVMNTLADVIGWQFARAGIDTSVGSGLFSTGAGDVPEGVEMPRIFGHRHANSTACPAEILGQLSWLRDAVNQRLPYLWLLRNDNRGPTERSVRYSIPGAQVYWGDWDGDGRDTPGSREGNTLYLRNSLYYGHPDITFTFGRPGAQLLVGDWDGDGIDTFAVREGREYRFYNSFSGANPAAVIHYGRSTDEVLVGDWDGDGIDTLAVRRGDRYYVINQIADGPAEFSFRFGRANDIVYVGDWNADGFDTVVARRETAYYFTNSLSPGADYMRYMGRADDVVRVGDWDGDGKDTMAFRRR